MSHFTVLVIGDDIEEQLQPYHEYESTGIEDEYVIEVNKDNEVKEFLEEELYVGINKETNELDYHYNEKNANETLHEWKKTSRYKYFLQKGLTEEEIEDQVGEYNGFKKKEDGSWYRKTNPNAKWDWWTVGGRWSGFFKLKPGSKGEVGDSGVFGQPAKKGYADSVLKKDIDFESMFKDAEEEAIEKYDRIYELIKDTPIAETWKSTRERIKNIDDARQFYNSQERVIKLKKHNPFADVEDYQIDRDTFIQRAKNGAISTYAIVKDNQWYSKGKMGWWGISSDEIDQDEWNKKVMELIESVPDDTLFTLVDCHI